MSVQQDRAENRVETRDVRVTGRVQGVGYRYATVRRAQEIGCTGWVRNLADGSVQALVQGAPAQVAQLLEWMRQGPLGAQVAAVEAKAVDAPERFERFVQRSTL
jgi:acylphosphatase